MNWQNGERGSWGFYRRGQELGERGIRLISEGEVRRLRAVSAASSSELRRREIGDDGAGPILQRARHAGEERASERWRSRVRG